MSVVPKALTDEEREAGEAMAHCIFERARVDVVRI